jgi:hypothetical protein
MAMVRGSINTPPDIDDLLRALSFWLDESNSEVIWPFVKRGLENIIDDLRRGSFETESTSPDRTHAENDTPISLKDVLGSNDLALVEEDIAKIEEFIKRQELRRAQWGLHAREGKRRDSKIARDFCIARAAGSRDLVLVPYTGALGRRMPAALGRPESVNRCR